MATNPDNPAAAIARRSSKGEKVSSSDGVAGMGSVPSDALPTSRKPEPEVPTRPVDDVAQALVVALELANDGRLDSMSALRGMTFVGLATG